MILVIGGTGTTGRAVLRRLAELEVPTRALVRCRSQASPRSRANPLVTAPCIEYVTGDAGEPRSLRAALRGVSQLFVAMANGPRQKDIEMVIVAEAAAAGVEHIVRVSAPVVGPDVPVAIARLHFAVEQAIESSSMAFTHLRPYGFMQNLLGFIPAIRRTGRFFATTGDTPMNMVDARDIADVAAVALTRPGSPRGAYVLTGPEAVSYPDVARRMSALGAEVLYVDQTPAALRASLLRAQLPPWLVEHILEIQGLAMAIPQAPNDTVLRVTGNRPRSLDAFLCEHIHLFHAARPAVMERGQAMRG
ncbi:MAG: NmrA family NAD(P)-binding protein [Myxococcota bacterium]